LLKRTTLYPSFVFFAGHVLFMTLQRIQKCTTRYLACQGIQGTKKPAYAGF